MSFKRFGTAANWLAIRYGRIYRELCQGEREAGFREHRQDGQSESVREG